MFKVLLALLLFFVPLSGTWGQDKSCFETDSTGGLKIDYLPKIDGTAGFVIGELDEVPGVPELKLALIKYLYEKEGVRDIFMEIGYSAAYYYQRYLELGDEHGIINPDLVYHSTAEGKRFWKLLYEYNLTIGQQLRVHGMDFERMEFLKLLKELGDTTKPVPPTLRPLVRVLDTTRVKQVNSPDLASIYGVFVTAYNKDSAAFKAYYCNVVGDVSAILCNPSTYAEYRNRNKGMYENIAKWYAGNASSHYVVFVGEKHLNGADSSSLTSKMKQNYSCGIIGTYDLVAETGNRSEADKAVLLRGPGLYIKSRVIIDWLQKQAKHCQGPGLAFTTSAAPAIKASSFGDFILYLKYSDNLFPFKR